MQQFDLLYMPSDTLYRNEFKCIFSRIDVASRLKVTRPLRVKQSKDIADMIADMIADICKVGPLSFPKVFQCDNGSEFKVGVIQVLEKHGVTIQCTMTKYKHAHMAFVKGLNKLLTEQLFKVQDTQELNNPQKVLLAWVQQLCGLVDSLKDTEMQMTRMKAKDTVKLKEVSLVHEESYAQEDTLPEDDCIITCCSLEKNTTTSPREPLKLC